MRSNKSRLKSLVKSVDKGSLVLPERGGEKFWRGYRLDVIKTVWARNFSDGFEISVFKNDVKGREEHIGNISFDSGKEKIEVF